MGRDRGIWTHPGGHEEWFVVQTNPREENLASVVLVQNGVRVYQPFMEKFVFHARRKTLKRYPLFPGYLFVHIRPEEEDFHKIRWSRGVRRILLANYRPVSIQDEFVESLVGSGRGDGRHKEARGLRPGRDGPHTLRPPQGHRRHLRGMGSDDGRVRILIEMVNNRAKVLVHPSLIEKA
jgi:transcriptional antiterminator RfaH